MAISKTRRTTVYKRDDGCCRFFLGATTLCKRTENLTLHHVTARRNGGNDAADNLVTLCVQHHNVLERNEEERKFQREMWKAEGRLTGKPRRKAKPHPQREHGRIEYPPGHFFDLYRQLAVKRRAKENFQAAWKATDYS